MKFDVVDPEGYRLEQYNVFERQLATTDQSIYNWRVSMSSSAETLNEMVESIKSVK